MRGRGSAPLGALGVLGPQGTTWSCRRERHRTPPETVPETAPEMGPGAPPPGSADSAAQPLLPHVVVVPEGPGLVRSARAGERLRAGLCWACSACVHRPGCWRERCRWFGGFRSCGDRRELTRRPSGPVEGTLAAPASAGPAEGRSRVGRAGPASSPSTTAPHPWARPPQPGGQRLRIWVGAGATLLLSPPRLRNLKQ